MRCGFQQEEGHHGAGAAVVPLMHKIRMTLLHESLRGILGGTPRRPLILYSNWPTYTPHRAPDMANVFIGCVLKQQMNPLSHYSNQKELCL